MSITVSRKLVGGLLAVVAGSLFLGGWALGVLTAQPRSALTVKTAPSSPPSHAAGTSTASNPFVVGTSFPFTTSQVETLTGHVTHLALGSRATIVMAMASWCLFCGYEDKYVLPVLARTPGVVVDIVDVSPQGGIADPGPATPPFHGHDGAGGPLTVAGMRTTMQHYVQTYGLAKTAIHVYVAPTATQQAWHVSAFPSLAFLNARGTVVVAPPGALTIAQGRTALDEALSGSSAS